jgi:hypothetical protein
MTSFFNFFAALFDGGMYLVGKLNPLVGLIIVSLLSSILVLWIYKRISNQKMLAALRQRIKSHFLAITVYKESIRVLFLSTLGVLWSNLRYLFYNIVPFIILAVPITIIMANLQAWYGNQAAAAGEAILLKAKFDSNIDVMKNNIQLQCPKNVDCSLSPVRIPQVNEIDWRLEPKQEGVFNISLKFEDKKYDKTLVAGTQLSRLYTKRHAGNFLDAWLYPGESALPSNAAVHSIELTHPARSINVFGWQINWIYLFFILTIIFAFGLKDYFKVTL